MMINNSYNKYCGFSVTIGFHNDTYDVEWFMGALPVINAKTYHALTADEMLATILSSLESLNIIHNGYEGLLISIINKLKGVSFSREWLLYLLYKYLGKRNIKNLQKALDEIENMSNFIDRANLSDQVTGLDLLSLIIQADHSLGTSFSEKMLFCNNPDALGKWVEQLLKEKLSDDNMRDYIGNEVIDNVNYLMDNRPINLFS